MKIGISQIDKTTSSLVWHSQISIKVSAVIPDVFLFFCLNLCSDSVSQNREWPSDYLLWTLFLPPSYKIRHFCNHRNATVNLSFLSINENVLYLFRIQKENKNPYLTLCGVLNFVTDLKVFVSEDTNMSFSPPNAEAAKIFGVKETPSPCSLPQ